MASLRLHFLLVLLPAILLLSHPVKSDDKEDNLLQGINSYRASLNLAALTKNDNADCLADEVADQLKSQPCSNTTGSFTVPGTESPFPNYPDLLAHCHLNITDTKDGVIMPVCVPNLDRTLVLSNFTQSQYNEYINNTKYTGVGIGSEDDWIVVVLSTNKPGGSFTRATSAALLPKAGLTFHLISLFLGFFLVLLS
ncbi:hypothetical protein BVC80_9037g5 [Macleaya cordata]|uniref:Uncharacterized GPI-anchored protein At5g19230-like domain-containing protein n=1 Tax=Macleaya cordata TaxID=56857 RepID=A0A200Q5P1_MACCD|nr:hypothetical protein BVC80_9037g5 [Macleaya cordata]